MRRISIMVGPLAALLCVGIAGAEGSSSPRTTVPAPPGGRDAPPTKDSAVNVRPVSAHAPSRKGRHARVQEQKVQEDDDPSVAEGDDGANGGTAPEVTETPPPQRAKVVAQARTTPPLPVQPSQKESREGPSASEGVDGPMVMGLMGGNINQMMRGGLMNMCPCSSKATFVQVSKLPKGVSISYVSDDPKVVARLQKMADGVRLMRDAWAD